MFARGGARAAQRALAATASASSSTLAAASPAWSPSSWRPATVKAAHAFAATMATVPFAVQAGSTAAGLLNPGGLLNPADLTRISNDLSSMKRTRIEGPQVPRAKAVLVPLCHDLHGVPHALFTVRPDDFGAPHADFPGGARCTDDSTAIAAAVREACAELGLDDLSKLRILGMTSDCPDVPRQTAVTPVVGYLVGCRTFRRVLLRSNHHGSTDDIHV
jgi:8-oxo-dGTP pyrophosphatase MutT (NUDIX family)